MKVEKTRDKQTQRIDVTKQNRTLLVPEGTRPNTARNGIFLFDGVCLCIRFQDEWITLIDTGENNGD